MESTSGSEQASKLLNDFQEISFGKIALILLASVALIWMVRMILPYMAERGPSRLRIFLLGAVPVLRLVLILGAILWIIPIVFNLTVQNFLVIAGGASVAIGFAFKDYASSIIAGIVALFERPYGAGDWVEIDGDYGEVVHVGFRAIQLRTAADDIVTVPHETIWTKNVANSNSGDSTLMCIAHFHLLPDHDAKQIETALVDVALTSAYLDYGRPVVVIVNETEFGTHYQLKAYPFDLRDQFSFVSELTIRGKVAVRREGGVQVAACASGNLDRSANGSGASRASSNR